MRRYWELDKVARQRGAGPWTRRRLLSDRHRARWRRCAVRSWYAANRRVDHDDHTRRPCRPARTRAVRADRRCQSGAWSDRPTSRHSPCTSWPTRRSPARRTTSTAASNSSQEC